MPRQIKGGLFFGLIGLIVGYVLATQYVNFRFALNHSYEWLLLNLKVLRLKPRNWVVVLDDG